MIVRPFSATPTAAEVVILTTPVAADASIVETPSPSVAVTPVVPN